MKFCKNKLILAALALLMSFSVSLNAYAAELLSVEGARDLYLSNNGVADLSDFWYTFDESGTDSRGSYLIHHFMFVNNNDLLSKIFVYGTSDSIIHFGYYDNSDCLSSSYAVSGVTQCVERGEIGFNSGKIEIIFNVSWNAFNFDTNIPWFDSKESAENYFNTGDTSGLLNSDSLPKFYDPTIETPKDFQINFSTSKIFDDKGFFNECDFQFTWKQSEDTDVNGYQTEIYIQATHCKVSITNLFGSADSREQKLGDKLLISSASTSYDNKASIKWNDLVAYLNKDGANLFGASNAGGVCCTYPIYFWVRNVKGNTYGDWIKVTVTPDNVVVDGNDYLGTGKGTVSHGYELVDGSGNGVQKENQYGQGYHVDIPYTSTNSIIDYIKSGFGLLGDNGLIAFFKDMFSFLPDPVWTIIFTMVGVCAIIMIIKVAK